MPTMLAGPRHSNQIVRAISGTSTSRRGPDMRGTAVIAATEFMTALLLLGLTGNLVCGGTTKSH
jgi:hypothetical protein